MLIDTRKRKVLAPNDDNLDDGAPIQAGDALEYADGRPDAPPISLRPRTVGQPVADPIADPGSSRPRLVGPVNIDAYNRQATPEEIASLTSRIPTLKDTSADSVGRLSPVGMLQPGNNSPTMSTNTDRANLDPLTRAQEQLGERKGPGFWGRLGQGLKALATGDGVGGFVMGLGDAYGKAAHLQKIQELAGRLGEQDKIAQQNIENELARRRAATGEAAQQAKEQYYQDNIQRLKDNQKDTVDYKDRQLQQQKDIFNQTNERLTKAEQDKVALGNANINERKAHRLVRDILLNAPNMSDEERGSVIKQINDLDGIDLPPDLKVDLANAYQILRDKRTGAAYSVDKRTGKSTQVADAQSQRPIIVYADKGGSGGGRGSKEKKTSWKQGYVTDPKGVGRYDPTGRYQIPVWIDKEGHTRPYLDANGAAIDPDGNPVTLNIPKKK